MSKETLLKFSQFFLIVLVGVVADQWTKWYAEQRLASRRIGHEIVLTVPEAAADQTAKEFLVQEFTWTPPEHLERMARANLRDDQGRRVRPEDRVAAGDRLHVLHREAVVVPDYWDFQYTRNPGAAFGFLADQDSPWRKPFFVVISIFAIGIILYILRGVLLRQQILIWGLSLIASGAIGNFIDRVRFSYVIDFIVWKYTDEHRWPTFNVADALICAGVGLMLIEIVRDTMRERRELAEAEDLAEDSSPEEDEEAPASSPS